MCQTKENKPMKLIKILPVAAAMAALPSLALAQDATPGFDEIGPYIMTTLLFCMAGFLVFFMAAGFAMLGFLPGLIDNVAARLGVAYPPVLALTLAIIVLVLKILLMDIERSRTEMRNQRLIQRVAMLESDLKKLQQTASEADNDKS